MVEVPPGFAPVNAGDTATFNTSTHTSPTLSANVTIDSITFNLGASPFTIQTNGRVLTLLGVGIVNNSGNVQTINNNNSTSGGAVGQTIFTNAATADSTVITNSGVGTSTQFVNNSTAGNATITNSGAGSFTAFTQGASGGNAALINANPTAFITIAELNGAGTTAGSIAGNGTIFLGSKNLTVGGNQQTTVFSGVISDGESSNLPPSLATQQPSYVGGSLTKVGTGTLTLTGINTYTGGTIIGGGTLQLGNGGTSGSVLGNIVDNGILAFNRSDSFTFSGVISGSGIVQQNGTGTTVLLGANTYAGGTNLNGGVLSISQDANLGTPPGAPAANHLTFNAGRLQATASFTLNPNRGITLNGGGGTFEITGANLLAYGGAITGAGNLTKVGTGTLTLAGNNTYLGSTLVSAGILQAGSATAFSANSAFTVNSQLDLNGFSNTIGSLAGNGIVTNNGGASATLAVGNDNTNTAFSGSLQDGTSTLGLTKVGTGTLTLAGNDTYLGTTLVSAGALQAGSATAFSANSAFTVNSQLDLNGFSNTIGSLAGNGIVTNNGGASATLAVGNDNTNTAFSGSLQDGTSTLGLTKVGTGTLTLAGNNTYLGTTLVSAGILQAGSGTAFSASSAFTVNSQLDLNGFSNTVGSLAGNGIVTNNGGASATLAVGNDNTNTAFSGSLQDGTSTLGLTKVGTGTLTLTGENTYTGETTINDGTLQLGNGGTTGSITGNVANNGILAFNRSDFITFDGLISGTGSLAKLGSGTLTLSNSNIYSGGTTIAGGTIVTQNASALGTGPVAFDNGTAFQVQNLLNVNGSWTVFPGSASVSGGTVQTFGDFNLGGGGTLIANASFNIPGAANINSSGLEVNSAFTVNDNVNLSGSSAAIVNGVLTSASVNVNDASSLVVNNSGTVAANVNVGPSALLGLFGRINGSVINAGFFQGTGVVNGNVFNSGIVSPGTSIGTLTINGNYTQSASGTLRIEVAGASPGQYDVLVVNGGASLAGRLQLLRIGGFRPRIGDQLAFLAASGGVSGTFNTIENDFLATDSVVVFNVIYLPNAVLLEAVQGSFAEFVSIFVGTPNAVAVGEALDSAVGDPRAAEPIGFLNNQTLTDLREDIGLISPEQLTSIFVIGVSLANVQTANLERRLDDIRAGSSGFSSAGFAINGSELSFQEGFAKGSGPEGKSGPAVFAPAPENRWGIFATGLGEFTNVDNAFNARGYDLATGGFTMGIDYRIGSHFAIGLTGGYVYTHADLFNGGRIKVNGGKLGLYGTAFGSGFYLDTAVVGGLSGYDTRRTALEGSASGETLGGDLNVLVAGGYDWKKGGLTIGPTASFQYTLVGFGDFTESGSLAPLAYPSQNAESLRTAFGMRASYDWKLGPIRLIPELRLAWQHEFGDTDYAIVSSFASGAGNSFTVNGAAIGRDSMLLGAGFAIHWNDRISTYAYYDGELFRTNYLSNNVSVGFRLTF